MGCVGGYFGVRGLCGRLFWGERVVRVREVVHGQGFMWDEGVM